MWIDKNKSKFNKKLCLGFIFIVILFTVCSCAQIKQSDGVLLNRESEWKYLDDTAYIAENYKNDQDWTAPGIDDSMWKQGKGSFGAKNGEKGSLGSSGVIDVLLNQYTEEGINQPTYFFRTSFLLEKPEEFQAFKAKVEYDDAIIIYINGEKVFEGNTPDAGYADNVSYGANKRIEAPNQEEFYITDTSMLNKGENVVAVEVHQVNEKSSDVFFSMEELKLLTEKPQQEEVIKPEAAADPENLELSELWVSPAADPMDYRIQALSNQEENLKIYYKEQQTDAGPMEKELSVAYKEGIEKYRYEAELSGLSANTRYEYYISNGKDRTKTYEIEIPDENGLYTFWFIGDPQFRENEIEEDFRVFSEVLQRGKEQWGKPQLLLAAGDIADDGEAVKGYEQFAEIDEFKYTPMLALKGNHDGDFFEYYFAEENKGYMGDNAYVIGEALLVTLDSNEKNFEEKEKFLQDAIQTHQKKWVIVAMHHSIFSVGEHSDSERLKEYRTKYAKMFSNANVDLVLMGHDHTYTRTWLIQDGLPMINELGDTLQKEEQQALYVTVNSSSGSKYYDIQNIPDYAAVYNQDYSPNITKVEVDTNEIRVLTCDGNTMEIVDDVTLRK